MTTLVPAADRDESSALVLHTDGDPLDRAASWTHLPVLAVYGIRETRHRTDTLNGQHRPD